MPTLEITEVVGEPREWAPKDNPERKFHSYKVKAKAPDGTEETYEINTKATSPPPALGPDEFEIKPSQGDFPPKLKRIYQGSSNGRSSGARDDYWQAKEQRDIESQARQGRAHAQEMALRWFALPEDQRPPLLLSEVKSLDAAIDYFHGDVQRFPLDADGGGGNRAPSGDGRTDEGATASESSTTAAVSTGFASDKQQSFFDRLLKKRGFDANQVEAINRFAETLPTDRVSKAMDGLNADDGDEADKAAAALMRLSDEWARKQSDVPWSDDE